MSGMKDVEIANLRSAYQDMTRKRNALLAEIEQLTDDASSWHTKYLRQSAEVRELVAENESFAALLDDPKRLRKHVEEKMQEEKENKEAYYDAMERKHWESIINNPVSTRHADE